MEPALDRVARETDKLEKAFKNENDTQIIEMVGLRAVKTLRLFLKTRILGLAKRKKKDYDREMKEILGEISAVKFLP